MFTLLYPIPFIPIAIQGFAEKVKDFVLDGGVTDIGAERGGSIFEVGEQEEAEGVLLHNLLAGIDAGVAVGIGLAQLLRFLLYLILYLLEGHILLVAWSVLVDDFL